MLYFPLPFAKIRISIWALAAAAAAIYAEPSVFTAEIIVCAVIHELGHIIAMSACGVKIHSITVMPFGAEIRSDVSMLPYMKEAFVASAGALANAVSGISSLAVYAFTHGVCPLFFAFANFFLAFINLLPIKTLDGGRALKSVLLAKISCGSAEKISDFVSLCTFALFASSAFYASGLPQSNLSLAFFCAYIFICAYIKGE